MRPCTDRLVACSKLSFLTRGCRKDQLPYKCEGWRPIEGSNYAIDLLSIYPLFTLISPNPLLPYMSLDGICGRSRWPCRSLDTPTVRLPGGSSLEAFMGLWGEERVANRPRWPSGRPHRWNLPPLRARTCAASRRSSPYRRVWPKSSSTPSSDQYARGPSCRSDWSPRRCDHTP